MERELSDEAAWKECRRQVESTKAEEQRPGGARVRAGVSGEAWMVGGQCREPSERRRAGGREARQIGRHVATRARERGALECLRAFSVFERRSGRSGLSIQRQGRARAARGGTRRRFRGFLDPRGVHGRGQAGDRGSVALPRELRGGISGTAEELDGHRKRRARGAKWRSNTHSLSRKTGVCAHLANRSDRTIRQRSQRLAVSACVW